MAGEIVKGKLCPKCSEENIVYNGNYYCESCDWTMPERLTKYHKEIIKSYLIQRRAESDNPDEIKRMEFYLRSFID